MKYFIFFPLLIFLFFGSCKPNKPGETDPFEDSILRFDVSEKTVANSKIPLSTFTEKIEYIPLETTEESILSRVSKIVPARDHFYIQSNEAIMKFGRKGKFKTKIENVGKGPGEYTLIKDFDVSPDGEKIAVQTWGKVLFFDTDGLFINEFMHDARFVRFVDDTGVLTYQSNTNGDKLQSHFLLNLVGDTLLWYENKFQFELKGKSLALPPIEFISHRFRNNLFYSEIQDDTLFWVNEKYKPIPYAIFDSKDKRMTSSLRATGMELAKSFHELVFLTTILESERYLYFTTQFSNYLYDKKTKEEFQFNDITNDIDGLLAVSPKISASDDQYFIAILNAAYIKEKIEILSQEKENGGIVSLLNGHSFSESDNQVLMLMHLRK